MCDGSWGPEIQQKPSAWEHTHTQTHPEYGRCSEHTRIYTHACRVWLVGRCWVGHSWTSQLDFSTSSTHINESASMQGCVYECVYSMQRRMNHFYLTSAHQTPPTTTTTTTTFNAPTSPKLFSLPHRSEPLFKNTITLFLLFHSACVPFTLILFHTVTHTHTCSPWPHFWGSLCGWQGKKV